MMTYRFRQYFMRIAEETAQLSYAVRLKVGAIIVKDRRVISIGYNGTPAGWDNCCEIEVDGKLVTKPEVLHAETNALAKLARSHESGEEATLFITHAPCIECAKLIHQSGIKEVYYKHEYRSTDGIEFLRKCNIAVLEADK